MLGHEPTNGANRSYDLLNDLNLSNRPKIPTGLVLDIEAQRNDLRRFAGAIEDILEGSLESDWNADVQNTH
jgi:hypothetical protein